MNRSKCLCYLGVAMVAIAFFRCGNQNASGGFSCGLPMKSNPEVIQKCDQPREVCVCETNSCAEKVSTSLCESGYRYVDSDFLVLSISLIDKKTPLKGTCVPKEHAVWLVISTDEKARQVGFRCNPIEPPSEEKGETVPESNNSKDASVELTPEPQTSEAQREQASPDHQEANPETSNEINGPQQ